MTSSFFDQTILIECWGIIASYLDSMSLLHLSWTCKELSSWNQSFWNSQCAETLHKVWNYNQKIIPSIAFIKGCEYCTFTQTIHPTPFLRTNNGEPKKTIQFFQGVTPQDLFFMHFSSRKERMQVYQFAYFEVTLKWYGGIAIGLAPVGFGDSYLGYGKNSIGYDVFRGAVFDNDLLGLDFESTQQECRCEKGDSVGLLWNVTSGYIYFTKNGRILEFYYQECKRQFHPIGEVSVFKEKCSDASKWPELESVLLPTVRFVYGEGAVVEMNFCNLSNRPFCFEPVNEAIKWERNKASYSLYLDHLNVQQKICFRNHLLHHLLMVEAIFKHDKLVEQKDKIKYAFSTNYSINLFTHLTPIYDFPESALWRKPIEEQQLYQLCDVVEAFRQIKKHHFILSVKEKSNFSQGDSLSILQGMMSLISQVVPPLQSIDPFSMRDWTDKETRFVVDELEKVMQNLSNRTKFLKKQEIAELSEYVLDDHHMATQFMVQAFLYLNEILFYLTENEDYPKMLKEIQKPQNYYITLMNDNRRSFLLANKFTN